MNRLSTDWMNVDFAARYGNGEVCESPSVCISNWNEPGVLRGKPARDCTEDEIAAEVSEQYRPPEPRARPSGSCDPAGADRELQGRPVAGQLGEPVDRRPGSPAPTRRLLS
ncbi:MAG: hypothetical protein Q8K58_02995, partial [Acidimicrobiales bacterium]|nr:hypothetical protein [Acidimicrobiales bacterium]